MRLENFVRGSFLVPRTERNLVSLRDTAATLRPKPDTRCKLGRLIPTLSVDDQAALTELLNGPDQHTYITAVLQHEGHPISETLVGRHRNGRCTCGNS